LVGESSDESEYDDSVGIDDNDYEVDLDDDFNADLHPDVSKNLMLWYEGRHVVEISVLSEYLDKGCCECGLPLRLSGCMQERHYGLGSLLYIVVSNINIHLYYDVK